MIGRRGYQEVGRAAIGAAVDYWLDKYLPLHFQNIAYLRYRYAPRDKRTAQLKRDRKPWPFGEHTESAIGEVAPLVYSGRTRERAKQARSESKAPNYQTYVGWAVINSPALNFSANSRIDLRDELTRLNSQEEITLGRVFGSEFERQLIARGAREPKQTRRIAA